MVAMAKRKPKTPEQPNEKPVRSGVNLNIWISQELADAITRFTEKTRRTKTTSVSILLEESLASHGEWPPPPDAESSR